ncbi:MAG: excinuclease ABC subunit A, partial [Piscirickettsiaceae bacterium]
IRKLFAYTVDAQTLGFEPARFSFNSSAGGRCTHCSGTGVIEIDMHFLANQAIICPECKGKRFNQETLAVKYRGRNIHDVLSMSIDEAFSFFHNHQSLQRRLQMLREVGLGYLSTGQSLATLSGGEAQRLKLASFLSESSGKSKLYLFDEPTAGLHPEDVATLISCFRRLVEQGHTVIAIDHHLLMLEAADC